MRNCSRKLGLSALVEIDDSWVVVEAALEALGRIGTLEARELLKAVASSDEDPVLRKMALTVVERHRHNDGSHTER